MSNVFLQSIIAYSLLIYLEKKEESSIYLQQKIVIFFVYGYILSIIISIICNQLNVFGKTDNFICFVNKDKMWVGLIIFYLPLVFVIAFNIFAFYKVLKYLGGDLRI